MFESMISALSHPTTVQGGNQNNPTQILNTTPTVNNFMTEIQENEKESESREQTMTH